MYIIKNALKSIIRTPVRNIFIGIIVCIIGICSCVSLSINSAASKIVDDTTESAEIIASFNLDRDKMKAQIREGKLNDLKIGGIPEEKIAEYADSEYVKEERVVTTLGMNSSQIEALTSNNFMGKYNPSEDSNSQAGGKGMKMMPMMGKETKLNSADFNLVSYNTQNAMEAFKNGKCKISEGEMFDLTSENMECIINKELAEENELEIGSNMIFTSPENENETYTYEIVGIYEDSSESTDMNNIFSNSANRIIVPTSTIKNIVEKSSLLESVNSTILLKNYDSIVPFKEEVENKGLLEGYKVETNEEEVLASIKPIQNLITFSNTFLVVVLIIGLVVLTIISAINVRERKYELGVLRAIGMKKSLVITQFVTEILTVSMFSMILATTVGSIISVPVSNEMLKSQVEDASVKSQNIEKNFGGGIRNMNPGKAQNVSYIESIDASINIVVVAKLFAIALVITLITSALSAFSIVRYNPLDILSNRT